MLFLKKKKGDKKMKLKEKILRSINKSKSKNKTIIVMSRTVDIVINIPDPKDIEIKEEKEIVIIHTNNTSIFVSDNAEIKFSKETNCTVIKV